MLQLGRGNSPQRVEGGKDSARSSRRGGRVVRRPGEHSHCCVTGGSAVRASGAGTLSWRRASPVVRNRGQVGRSSTRPVLKHGPRSLTCARVTQSCLGSRGAMKVKLIGGDSCASTAIKWWCLDATTAGSYWLLTVELSYSVHVGTRKMVNYAWARRSQRKLWWRSVAILTCKSIVRPGYRGERLIEPSSSWFPLKFPSG